MLPLVLLVVVAQAVVLALLVTLLRRSSGAGVSRLESRIEALERAHERAERGLREELARGRDESLASARGLREEVGGSLQRMGETLQRSLETTRATVEFNLRHIREDNVRQLEQVRQAVDEKLQGALERRLGESFRLVSERLEQVHRGLGEMQTLASGVGDLKRVLVNVKVRGTWGEVQLGSLLEQVLTPEQFATNVATRAGSAERVEFAIRLPGRGDTEEQPVWLPIDAKFPQEDYQRLVDAHDRADPEGVERAARQLELRVRQSARDICDKYLNPPATTDFAILFLPTEGLYSEVVRRPGLVELVQRECRVMLAGPTTLWALLNSLQMGFRTLAIQQRSSEVWKVLGAVKTEFGKFGDTLDRVQRKLHEASNVVEDAGRRRRVMERTLRQVEAVPAGETETLLENGHRSSVVGHQFPDEPPRSALPDAAPVPPLP